MASNPSEENVMPSENAKEVFNRSRHEHKLCFSEGHPRYRCNGCRAFGANKGFECKSCPEFMLHEECADSPDEYNHPFFPNKPLQFRPKTHLRRHCDGCGEVLRGFMFQSHDGHLKLHPLCMTLPSNLSFSGHKDHSLKLFVEGGKYNCTQCNMKNKKWKYRCERTTCRVNLDMNCAIVDLHRMFEHGINLVQRPSHVKHVMKKVATEVTTFVGKYFVEGLAQGLGIGVASELFGDDEKGDDNEEGNDTEEDDIEEAGEEGGGGGNQPSGH